MISRGRILVLAGMSLLAIGAAIALAHPKATAPLVSETAKPECNSCSARHASKLRFRDWLKTAGD